MCSWYIFYFAGLVCLIKEDNLMLSELSQSRTIERARVKTNSSCNSVFILTLISLWSWWHLGVFKRWKEKSKTNKHLFSVQETCLCPFTVWIV